MVPNGVPDASKRSQNLIKNELETKFTKHVENVLNLISRTLKEKRFRIAVLPKIIKTRGADKYKTILKNGVETEPESMKIRPRKSTGNEA